MQTFIFDIEKLFNLVIQRTVYLSSQVDQSDVKADLIPMTEDDREWFYTALQEASTLVWERMGTWAAADPDKPYIFDLDGAEASTSNTFNHIVYKVDPPPAYVPKLQDQLVLQAIQNALVFRVTCDWLMIKGFDQADKQWQIDFTKHSNALLEIRRYMEYKERPKTIYRTF